jgi:hypothetical protein
LVKAVAQVAVVVTTQIPVTGWEEQEPQVKVIMAVKVTQEVALAPQEVVVVVVLVVLELMQVPVF